MNNFIYHIFRIFCLSSLFATSAWADWGEGQVIYEPQPSFTHEGRGNIAVTGASLTDEGASLLGSTLYPTAKTCSSASMANIPADATLVKAYLVWAASGPEATSLDNVVADSNAVLQLPNGTTHTITADATEIRKWHG